MSSSNNVSWFSAGLASSYANIEPNDSAKTKLKNTRGNKENDRSPARILRPPSADEGEQAVELTPDEAQETLGFSPQVLVFKYRGKIHALNHNCPHRNYPLSRGSLYDIEDFGIVLSAGITCPGHGWEFDINTGQCSRGAYKLDVWKIELRPNSDGEEEVWVRINDGAGR